MSERSHSHALKRTLRMIGGVGILIGGTIFFAILLVRVFTIRQVLVDAPGMSISLDIHRFGKNLLTIPTTRLRNELLSTYPLLSDVTFEKKIPSTLIVRLTRRDPFVVLESSGNSYAVDEYGLVLGGIDTPKNYTELVFDIGVLSAGTTVKDSRVLGALTFLRSFASARDIQAIRERDSSSFLAEMNNTNIILAQQSDLGEKAATLQLLIDGFRIKGILPTVIDLRFSKPIITN